LRRRDDPGVIAVQKLLLRVFQILRDGGHSQKEQAKAKQPKNARRQANDA
jgi:hypothetical protein